MEKYREESNRLNWDGMFSYMQKQFIIYVQFRMISTCPHKLLDAYTDWASYQSHTFEECRSK